MLTKNTWKEVPFSGFPERSFHTSTLFKHYIITYGGYSLKTNFWADEPLEIFNIEKGQLEKFNLKGDELQPVQRHSACLIDSNKILIFGGFSNSKIINNVAIIIIEETSPLLTLTYKKIVTIGGEDYVACSHTANLHKNKMYVFGGRINSKPSANTNELWSLDLENFHWEQCETTGDKPLPRTSHYSAIYDNKLYIFGGYHDSTETMAEDCYILSLDNFQWEKLKTENINFLCRSSPSRVFIGDEIFIMGGIRHISDKKSRVISYNFKKNTIKNVTSEGKYSDSRFATAVASKSHIFVWGGQGIGASSFQLSSLQIGNVYQGEEASLSTSSLFNLEQYSDIHFSIEGQNIPAHKLVLGTKCKYFNDMFTSGMKESQAQILEITDVKLETFQAFLRFLYQNRVEFTEPLAMDLYVLADKYMQKDLADVCENFLADSVDLNNFEQMNEFAELYGVELLKETISEFVEKKNKKFFFPKEFAEMCGEETTSEPVQKKVLAFSKDDESSQAVVDKDPK